MPGGVGQAKMKPSLAGGKVGPKYGYQPFGDMEQAVQPWLDDVGGDVKAAIKNIEEIDSFLSETAIDVALENGLKALKSGDMEVGGKQTHTFVVYNPADLEILRILGLSAILLGGGSYLYGEAGLPRDQDAVNPLPQ